MAGYILHKISFLCVIWNLHISSIAAEQVAAWHFNATPNRGSDISVNGENDVTNNIISYGLGPNSEALGAAKLEGTALTIPTPTTKLRFANGEFTVWAHVFIKAGSNGYLFQYGDSGASLRVSGANLILSNTESSTFTAQSAINLDQWNTIAGIYTPTSITLVINGATFKTETVTAPTSNDAGTGTGSLDFGTDLMGRLACVQIYNCVLDASQIAKLVCGSGDIPCGTGQDDDSTEAPDSDESTDSPMDDTTGDDDNDGDGDGNDKNNSDHNRISFLMVIVSALLYVLS